MGSSCSLSLLCLLMGLLSPPGPAPVEAETGLDMTDDEIEDFLQSLLKEEDDAEGQGAEKVAQGEDLSETQGSLTPAERDRAPVEVEEGENHPVLVHPA